MPEAHQQISSTERLKGKGKSWLKNIRYQAQKKGDQSSRFSPSTTEGDVSGQTKRWKEELNIRLVHLQPRSFFENEIHCHLYAQKLVADSYEALSYEWGDFSPELSITLDGVDVPVRENLWWALWHLRLEDKPRILWIDALCINQNDTEDRSYQVSRMDYIYHSAVKCIAWLGKEEVGPGLELDDCKLAIDFITRIYANTSTETLPLSISPEAQQELDSLELLCRRKYWTRLWIIQEILLSTEVQIQCGPYSVPWKELRYLFNNLKTYIHASYQFSISSSAPFRLHWGRPQTTRAGVALRPLAGLVLQFKDSQCQDPRDTVFGLLGLTVNCCRAEVPADYSTTPEKLCTTLLLHHIAHHLNLRDTSPDIIADIRDICLRVTTQSNNNKDLQASIASLSMKARHSAYPQPSELRLQRGQVIWTLTATELRSALQEAETTKTYTYTSSVGGRVAPYKNQIRDFVTGKSSLLPRERLRVEDCPDFRKVIIDRLSAGSESWITKHFTRNSAWERQRDHVLRIANAMPLEARLTHIYLTDTGHLGITTAKTQLGDFALSSEESDLKVVFYRKLFYDQLTTFFDLYPWPAGYEYGISLDPAMPFQELLSWVQ